MQWVLISLNVKLVPLQQLQLLAVKNVLLKKNQKKKILQVLSRDDHVSTTIYGELLD